MIFDLIVLGAQILASIIAIVSAYALHSKDWVDYLWPTACFMWALAWFRRGK